MLWEVWLGGESFGHGLRSPHGAGGRGGGNHDEGGVEEGGATLNATAVLQRTVRVLLDLTLHLPSALHLGRSTTVCAASTSLLAAASTSQPTMLLPLLLYSYEGGRFCRLVREVLAELDLVHKLRSCGKGSRQKGELPDLTGGLTWCPYLIDPNTVIVMAESGI